MHFKSGSAGILPAKEKVKLKRFAESVDLRISRLPAQFCSLCRQDAGAPSGVVHFVPMNFIEVTVATTIDSGEILALLEDGESLGAWEADGFVHLFYPENRWNSESLEELERILIKLGIKNPGALFTIRTVPDQDWNAAWAASLNPIRLGQRFRIRQSWHAPDQLFDGFELVIDPQRAFGTGYHATTQLVVEWLEENVRGGERVLDIGTGTGILSMAAVRLGAASALAIDNDPVAIECAREYARVNHFGAELNLEVASFEDLPPREYDIVVANLDIRTMPLLCPQLPGLLKKGGRACLSGLQPQDLDEIAQALTAAGLELISRTGRDEWIALSIRYLRASGEPRHMNEDK
jgi:ribosomal protein L11 methyltransferase